MMHFLRSPFGVLKSKVAAAPQINSHLTAPAAGGQAASTEPARQAEQQVAVPAHQGNAAKRARARN
jgi:hypothetical protein